ncbi:tetratricopeptide repeat protein [Thermomonas alba]|uniref:tetratricopeptide repeat protein n=1 Tax=Thermomonas alba TaxID=2888525 RepID=UPI0023D912E4|nr:tetratricopeptide repeat protein [Thermomonas alba]
MGWRSKRLALCFLLAVLFFAPPSMAGSDKGVAAYGGDYAKAYRELRPRAEQGDAAAQKSLGWMYENGLGVAGDDAEAAKWHRKAAEQGDAAAQNNLGWMYANGWGVARDDAEAVQWYRKAAEQGYAAAQNNLGWMYANGRGVPRDDAEAVRWYRKAAEQGDAMAQYNLGRMYESGQGVDEDKMLAYALYNLAVANNPFKEKTFPADRDRLAKTLSRAELLEGQALTRELGKPGNLAKVLAERMTNASKEAARQTADGP